MLFVWKIVNFLDSVHFQPWTFPQLFIMIALLMMNIELSFRGENENFEFSTWKMLQTRIDREFVELEQVKIQTMRFFSRLFNSSYRVRSLWFDYTAPRLHSRIISQRYKTTRSLHKQKKKLTTLTKKWNETGKSFSYFFFRFRYTQSFGKYFQYRGRRGRGKLEIAISRRRKWIFFCCSRCSTLLAISAYERWISWAFFTQHWYRVCDGGRDERNKKWNAWWSFDMRKLCIFLFRCLTSVVMRIHQILYFEHTKIPKKK